MENSYKEKKFKSEKLSKDTQPPSSLKRNLNQATYWIQENTSRCNVSRDFGVCRETNDSFFWEERKEAWSRAEYRL